MTTVADLAAWLERIAPTRLAESWDNVGLLWGDPASPVDRAMTCLTVTPETADEAIADRAGAIVSHHPILFRPTRTLRADRPDSAHLWRLARAGVAVLSHHTAYDNAAGGINDHLAGRLGLVDVRPLRPATPSSRFKVAVTLPEGDRDAVLAAGFAAGAGRVGDYAECSFTTGGLGTFLGGPGTTPAVGRAGVRESVAEGRVEMVCPGARLAEVVAAIRAAHRYEEPAIDAFALADAVDPGAGSGRVGRLEDAEPLDRFAGRVGRALGTGSVGVVGASGRAIATVAISCGAGDDFIADAHRAGADVLLTGEARFHRLLEAEAAGVALIVAGHHATERPGVVDLASRIGAAFPGLSAWASRREADPLRTVPIRP